MITSRFYKILIGSIWVTLSLFVLFLLSLVLVKTYIPYEKGFCSEITFNETYTYKLLLYNVENNNTINIISEYEDECSLGEICIIEYTFNSWNFIDIPAYTVILYIFCFISVLFAFTASIFLFIRSCFPNMFYPYEISDIQTISCCQSEKGESEKLIFEKK